MPKKDNSTQKPVWVDPDDAPVWTKAVFDRAEIREGDTIIRPATGTLTKRGRPKLESPKQRVTLRVDGDVLAKFRESGPGWQGRMNEALRKAVMA
jgi:uncharacterized protein (DUF4415 family)